MRKTIWLAALGAALVLTATAGASQDLQGKWFQDDGNGDHYHIHVLACGNVLCGDIVWMSRPNDEQGRPRLDAKNPDPSLRSRPVLGIRVGFDIKPAAPNAWAGRMYTPKRGSTYDMKIKLLNPDLAEAYIGPPLLGKTLWLPRVKP